MIISISQELTVICYFDYTKRKFPENELTELFTDGSGDLLSENFEPAWFLLEHHHGTSFDDLRIGLSYLKRKVDSQNEGQLSFLKVSDVFLCIVYFNYYVYYNV